MFTWVKNSFINAVPVTAQDEYLCFRLFCHLHQHMLVGIRPASVCRSLLSVVFSLSSTCCWITRRGNRWCLPIAVIGSFLTFINTCCWIIRRGNRWCLPIAITGCFLTFIYLPFRSSWFTEISINSRLAWSGFSFAHGYSKINYTLGIHAFFWHAERHAELADNKLSQKVGAAHWHCITRFAAENGFQV